MELAGRSVLITGAARGIGRALVDAAQTRGARVTAVDRDAEAMADLAAELGPRHHADTLEVTDAAATEQLLTNTAERQGPVEVFFANAGIAEGGELLETDDAVWDRVLDANLRAHIVAARALLPGWLERGEGYFVSTTSAAGLLTQIGSGPYSVSKHAAIAFSEWLSVTYGGRGVRVSTVCPMGVATAMLEPGQPGALGERGAEVVRSAGEVLTPETVAATVIEAMREEQFLVLPHPEVLTLFQHKGSDYARWLAGMRRLYDAGSVSATTGGSA